MAPSHKAGTEAALCLSARGRENMVRTVDAGPAQQGVSVRSGQGGPLWLERRESFLEAVASDPPMFMSPLG